MEDWNNSRQIPRYLGIRSIKEGTKGGKHPAREDSGTPKLEKKGGDGRGITHGSKNWEGRREEIKLRREKTGFQNDT